MYTENANRAASGDPLTPDDYEPNSKNLIIAAFLRNIGMADELGSGVRRLFKYVRRYSGKDPQMLDGDVFRTFVPLDEDYSFDANTVNGLSKSPRKAQNKARTKHEKRLRRQI